MRDYIKHAVTEMAVGVVCSVVFVGFIVGGYYLLRGVM